MPPSFKLTLFISLYILQIFLIPPFTCNDNDDSTNDSDYSLEYENEETSPEVNVGNPNPEMLPNEYNELISAASQLAPEKYSKLLTLRSIISHMSFAEQLALIKSVQNGGERFFDYDTYIEYMTQHGVNYFHKEVQELSKYIEDHERILSEGAACYNSIASKFSYEGSETTNKVKTIVNNMLLTQGKNNKCQAQFILNIYNLNLRRRAYLFELKESEVNPDTEFEQNVFFVYNRTESSNDIVGIKYKGTEIEDLINYYKAFARCQTNYTRVLTQLAMEAQIELSHLDGCIGSEANDYAGNSSDATSGENTIRKGSIVGVNNANKIRPDRKTVNGYFLNYGFKFGEVEPLRKHYKYPDSITNKAKDVLRYFGSYDYFFNVINDIASNTKDITPIDGLYDVFVDSLKFDGDIGKDFDDASDQANMIFLQVRNWVVQCPKNFIIKIYSHNNSYYCEEYDNKSCPLTAEAKYVFNFHYTTDQMITLNNAILYVYCKDIDHGIAYVEGTDPHLGRVFDFISNNETMGKSISNTIQSCFGSFASGASGDKDACRDVVTTKCGNYIDRTCKNSGLYDYISAYPANSVGVPYVCINAFYGDYPLECFELIEKQFIAGTLSIKPSAVVGNSLFLARTSNEAFVFEKKEWEVYGTQGTYDDPDRFLMFSDHVSELTAFANANAEYINILGATTSSHDVVATKTALMKQMYLKQINMGKYIVYNKYSQGSQQHHSVKPKHLTFKLNLAPGGGASPVYVSRGTMMSGSHMLKKYGVKPQLQKYNTLSSTNIHCKYKHIPHINKYRHTNTHMLNTLLDSKLKETDYYKNIFTDNNNQCKFNTISLKFHPEPLDPLIQKELDIITTTTNNNNKTCSPSSHYQQRFSRNTPSSPHAITPSKSNYTTPYANKPAFAASLPVNRVASASNLLHLNTNKLLFSNISPSKKHFILKLAELQHELGTTASSASIQYIKQLKKPNNPPKRSALIDRYMFKMVNPDGTIDDYITEDETKPRDKYKRFRNQLVKEKNKIYRLKQDVKRKQMLTDTAITIPIPKLKKRNKVMYD